MSRIRMLWVAVLCLAAVLNPSGATAARNIDRFLTGAWYNPAQNGHGFSLEVAADGTVVIYWYTYHPNGTPLFLLAVGEANGNRVVADAYYNTGMHFGSFDPDDRTESPWGTITITFNNCNSATVEYDSTFSHGGTPFGSGSFTIQRLLSIDQLQCQDDPRAGIYEGTIYSDLDGAIYYGFALVAPGGDIAIYSAGGVGAFGEIEVNGLTLEASGTAVSLDPDTPNQAAFSGDGDFSPEHRLFSFYELVGGDEGYADFYATPVLYRRGITPAELAGAYEVFNPITGFDGTANITGGGAITGSDELGCQYAGSVTIPDTRFNLFRVSVTISNCPGYDGLYQGLGSQIDWFVVDDGRGLRVLVSDGNFGFLLLGNR